MSARRTISGPRPPRSGSQSLERGLDILEMIEAESGDIGVREIGAAAGAQPDHRAASGDLARDARIHREEHGDVALSPGPSHDDPGRERRARCRLCRNGPARARPAGARASSQRLRRGAAWRARDLPAGRAGRRPGRDPGKSGQRNAAAQHGRRQGAAGLAGRRGARKLLGHRKLAAITPHTITDPAALLASLAKVRRQGYATVVEENIPGVLSVGAPITDRGGNVVAALSMAFPSIWTADMTLQGVMPLVTAAALRISRRWARESLARRLLCV